MIKQYVPGNCFLVDGDEISMIMSAKYLDTNKPMQELRALILLPHLMGVYYMYTSDIDKMIDYFSVGFVQIDE